MTVDYNRYANYVGSICDSGNLSAFKINQNYTYMLEHVTFEQGQEYLNSIRSTTNITEEDIREFCTKNDAIGDPSKRSYGSPSADLVVSPSSLRYLLHAYLILTHIKSVGQLDADVIELGGGYGGLCLAVHHLAPKFGVQLNSYTICDLPNIIRLQKIYLERVDPAIRLDVVDANTYGEAISCTSSFLISNYCFSEITMEHQNAYRKVFFPKVSHGFIAWNNIPVYDIGFTLRIEPEVPSTGPMNKYVYF